MTANGFNRRLTVKTKFLIVIFAIVTLTLSVFAVTASAGAEEPSVSIDKFNLVFDDNVYLKYAVKFHGIDDDDITSSKIGMLYFTSPSDSYVTGKENHSSSVVGFTDIGGEKYYTFEYRHINAKQMTDYVYSVAYLDHGGERYYSEPVKFSVLDYAYAKLGKTGVASENESFKDMLSEMLQYGEKAQIYFNYNTSRLANDEYFLVEVNGGTLEDGFTKGLYNASEEAILSAPASNNGKIFDSWKSASGEVISIDNPARLSGFAKNETYTAFYIDDPVLSKNTIEDSALPHYSYSDNHENLYNRDLFYKNSYEIPLGDPTVLPVVENGVTWFYVTGTTSGSGFEMWKTRDFNDWEDLGTVYSPPENFFGKSSFWAPQLIYDETADRKYYLQDENEEGTGLYILFFSARRESNACALSVAFSKTPEGPYKNFVGYNSDGDYVDETNSCFEIEKLNGLGLYSDHVYGDLYKKDRSFIDASPFVDPLTGDKYLYMVRNRNVDKTNDVWGIKMKDWVTPDYETTTPLTSYGYTDILKSEPYSYLASESNKIDEGPFLYYKDATDDGIDNGNYYLTFSIGGTSDKLYPVCQAVSDSPLGPFTKIQPEDGGFINVPEDIWDIHGSGHHAFFEVGGELYIAYHTYQITSGTSIAKRYFAFDKIEWDYNEDGLYLMRSNGPSKSINPLPEDVSGYKNVATEANVTVSGNASASASLLNDKIIANREADSDRLLSFSDSIEITLTFDEYVNARAIMIYNSYDYCSAFSIIDRIEFYYRKEIDGKIYFGTAYIENLEFNFANSLIPESYLSAKEESNLLQLRPSCSAIAEFDEIEINCVKIYATNRNIDGASALSEIVILGKDSDTVITDSSVTLGGLTHEPTFSTYTSFLGALHEMGSPIKIDGVLDEELWKNLAAVTAINGVKTDAETKKPVNISLYGERSAEVYTYIGEKYVYFAFDVKDKNLYFNSSRPQGRSSGIEIYFTTADNDALEGKCYSIRVNPIGDSGILSYNLGVYVPNENGTEWNRIYILPDVYVGVQVYGHVQTSADPRDTSGNVGYTVEIAFDKSLIGIDADSFRFTAAFVQARGYTEERIGNSFIDGTHYVKPSTWVVFTNKEADE